MKIFILLFVVLFSVSNQAYASYYNAYIDTTCSYKIIESNDPTTPPQITKEYYHSSVIELHNPFSDENPEADFDPINEIEVNVNDDKIYITHQEKVIYLGSLNLSQAKCSLYEQLRTPLQIQFASEISLDIKEIPVSSMCHMKEDDSGTIWSFYKYYQDQLLIDGEPLFESPHYERKC